MNNLYETLMQAQNGQAMVNMARMFGISEEQAKAAVKATLPAFSYGLEQNTATPQGLEQFLAALGSGQHAKYFDDAAAMMNPWVVRDGEGVLGHLFGSRDVSRMVADQAAQATGIGSAIIKQMLPMIASMIMGALFRNSQGSGMQSMIEEIIKQMTGGAGMPQPQQRAPEPQPAPGGPMNDPFGDIFRDILGGRFGQSQSSGRSSGRGVPEMPQLPQTGADFFGAMFQPGIDAAQQFQDSQINMMKDMIKAGGATKSKKKKG